MRVVCDAATVVVTKVPEWFRRVTFIFTPFRKTFETIM